MGKSPSLKSRNKQRNKKSPSQESLGWGIWLNQSTNRLIKWGHSLEDIKKYSINQFVMFLRAIDELDAENRCSFVADMAAVVGSLFNDKKPSPVTTHLEELIDVASGVKYGS